MPTDKHGRQRLAGPGRASRRSEIPVPRFGRPYNPPPREYQTTGIVAGLIRACCALAASGHAAAPPNEAMNRVAS